VLVRLASKRDLRLKAKKSRTLKKRVAVIASIVVVVAALVVVVRMGVPNPAPSPSVNQNKVLLVTSMGNITIQLYEDMPITAGNFRNLVGNGSYDGTTFHRVARNFVIQGGNVPSAATIRDELPNKHSNVVWSVAMAKTSQPDSATSQFFISLKDNSLALDPNYSVFGIVVDGTDVVAAIGNVETEPVDDGTPLTPITIISARLVS
jgi:peptidylprolyl isomerase